MSQHGIEHGAAQSVADTDGAVEPCSHDHRSECHGLLDWECRICGQVALRERAERRTRMMQRLGAARSFAEQQDRRKVSYALSGRH